MRGKAAGLAFAVGVSWVVMGWPWLDRVETGRTPEYPDLEVREYRQAETEVAQAAMDAVAGLSGWALVGTAGGREGVVIRTQAVPPILRIASEVTIRIRRQGNATLVSVTSASRLGLVDLGRNARHVRRFLRALDTELTGRGKGVDS